MFFQVKVVTMPQFNAWLSSKANAATALAAEKATNQQTSSVVPTKPFKSQGDN
jgi:heme/copper-type cytochrome/quinol oxidase subunit 2